MIRALARASVRNPVGANLAMLVVALAGVAAYLAMPREVFPDFSLGRILVTTAYPGASPEDVERLVTLPIEERVEGLDGVREVTSRSQEGLSTVDLVVREGTDLGRLLDDVRAAVTSGDLGLPVDVDDPVVRELESEFPVIGVFVYGHAPEAALRAEAERHQRALEAIPGVGQVQLQGTREPRIWVEADPLALERHGLSLDDVGRAVAARAGDVPAGSLTTASGDYLVRVAAEVEAAGDLRHLPVVATPTGAVVRLGDVARVLDAHERPVAVSYFEGAPSVYLRVTKSPEGDAVDIAREVWAHLERERERTPPGIALGANSDLSVYVRNRLAVMRDSAVLGGLLVLCALVAFLPIRVAGMTALGVPVSFLGGILAAGVLGVTMNMMTMFALIVVLGMIVDDAIVVAENAYRRMEEGLPPPEAAVEGTAEVGRPVVATILTTMAAFLPVLGIGGTMGEFLRPIPLVVTLCLAASMVEALFVLPAHLAHWSGAHWSGAHGSGARARAAGASERVPRASRARERHWYDPPRDLYLRLLGAALRWRWPVLAGVAVGTVLLVAALRHRIPFVLFDDFEAKVFAVDARMPAGTPLRETERRLAEVRARALGAIGADELESHNTVVGVSYQDATRYLVEQNLGQVWIELREEEAERRATAAIVAAVRSALDPPPEGVESVEVLLPQAGPTGRAIDVAVRGPDLEVLRAVAGELQEDLRGFRGVRDVRDDDESGKRVVRVRLREAGRLLGLTEAGLGRELRAAFEGVRYARVRRGAEDVEIHVKLPEELRLRRDVLARLTVPLPGAAADGAGPTRVPLGLVAELVEEEGVQAITRDDGERSIRVTADVDKAEGNAAEVTAELARRYADLGERHPGHGIELQGEHRDTAESLEGLRSALLLSALLIYLILGTVFQSFLQPVVIMSAIPFGLLGTVLGHVALDRSISFLSLVGLLALTGIVVNDSLILVDFVNRRRRAGAPLLEALVLAGRDRFRPIVLTSVTTMLGLSPLTFFASGQARFLQPMAISVFFGLACSTLLILVAVPCAYAALEDAVALVRRPRQVLRRLARDLPVHGPEPDLSALSRAEP